MLYRAERIDFYLGIFIKLEHNSVAHLTLGNRTPMIASSGLERKHSVISLVTSLLGRLVPPFVSKWQAICWETSSRTASGSGITDHGLSAEPLSRIAR